MQFYKYEGSTAAEEWTEENDDRRTVRQRARKIAMKTSGFNLQQENKACLFVSNVSKVR